MTQSPDHPELLYVEARTSSGGPMYTIGRPDGPPLWVVIHDMEAVESPSCAENTANYFHTGAGGRSVSSHYTADDNSIVQCVLLRHSAWTVGNRPGNNRGINWELCGFAAQSREQWLDAFGRAMFARTVPIIRSDAAKYGIPLVRRTVAELKAWKPGVTSHNDLGVAFGGSDHTDPGANFPWDVFMALLTGTTPAPPTKDEPMYAMKEQNNTAVWLTNGLNRRAGITWVAITAMHAAGLIQTPTSGTDSSGFVYVVPDGQIAMYAGPEAHGGSSSVVLTPEQLAVIAASAQAGAEAGAPTHEELVAAAAEGSELAEDS